MPYIDVNISNKLSEKEEEVLKSKLGELISIIPGKTEDVLMIGINDGYTIYFSGQRKEKVAYVNIKLFKEAAFQHKAAFVEKVAQFLESEYGVTANNLFITFGEYDSWGVNGKLMG
jgi:phenylpyruvate tautomerase PptA (4-oxalocrotonate tautomerase family)